MSARKQPVKRLRNLARLPVLALLLAAIPMHAQLPAGTTDATAQPQSDPLRAQADAALDARDFPTALKLLTTLAEKYPTDAHLLYDLASTQDALEQNTAAIETYRRAISADPKFFEPHLALALLLARQGQPNDAKSELTTAVTLDAPTPTLKARAYRTLARLEAGGAQPSDPSAASADLLAALKITPETPDDILLAAELAEATGDLPAAEASYRRILAVTPNDPPTAAALAHLFILQKKPADAEAILTAALTQHPGDIALNAQLATIYISDDDPAKSALALPMVEKLHTANSSDTTVTRLLARLYSRSGDYAQADTLFAALIIATPPNSAPDPTLLDDRADALIHLHQPAPAEALLKKAIANPTAFPSKDDLGIAASHLAFAASQNNDPNITLQALALRATVLPQSPSALFLAATAHDKLHEVKVASDLYKQFLSVANGQFPDEEWEARHRLVTLEHMK
jgi:tetratricopeptide (TPR) repeat protein